MASRQAAGVGGGVAHLWFPDVATVATNDEEGRSGVGKGFPELHAFNTTTAGWDMCMPRTGLAALFRDCLRHSLWDRFSERGLLRWVEDGGGLPLFPFHSTLHSPLPGLSLLPAIHLALSFLLIEEERNPEEWIQLENESSCRCWAFISQSF